MSETPDGARPEAASREYPSLDVRDALVAGGAGLAGMVAMLPILLVAYLLGALNPEAFTALAEIVGLGGTPYSFLIGMIIFVGGGMTTLPLLFVSLAEFLPPANDIPISGVTYATVVWTGFVIAFDPGLDGLMFGLYLVMTLAAHWAYGYVLGEVYSRYATVPAYRV